MTTGCPPCSQAGGERSNPQGEARGGELASRNTIELDSASLHYEGATILPEMVKSAITGGETSGSNQWAPRGDWRQRAGKEKSRNLRGPNPTHGRVRESDVPIVAKKRGNSRGAKGDNCKYATVEV